MRRIVIGAVCIAATLGALPAQAVPAQVCALTGTLTFDWPISNSSRVYMAGGSGYMKCVGKIPIDGPVTMLFYGANVLTPAGHIGGNCSMLGLANLSVYYGAVGLGTALVGSFHASAGPSLLNFPDMEYPVAGAGTLLMQATEGDCTGGVTNAAVTATAALVDPLSVVLGGSPVPEARNALVGGR